MSSSYRHQAHAGNFADVHKHWLLKLLLDQLLLASAPLHYLESHAGAGSYQRGRNFGSGIDKLWRQPLHGPSLVRYRALVEKSNPDGQLCHYPGSPLIASRSLRPRDRATLVERDGQVFTELAHNLAKDTRMDLRHGDGLSIVTASLPRRRRWLLLVDPPFSRPAEFHQIAFWLSQHWRLLLHGHTALWYPLTQRQQHVALLNTLALPSLTSVLCSEFRLRRGKQGMFGSGMCLLNPPPDIAQRLHQEGTELATHLECVAHQSLLCGQEATLPHTMSE